MDYGLKDKEVTVRKPRRCSWCGEGIAIGERARNRVYIADGFTYEYMHPECYQAMLDTPYWYGDDGWEFGQFRRGVPGQECDYP